MVLVASFPLGHTMSALATEDTSKSDCEKVLISQKETGSVEGSSDQVSGSDILLGGSGGGLDAGFEAGLESYKLDELPGLVEKHPSIMMSATQRLYSIVLAAGSERKVVRGKGEHTIFNLFSEPNEFNGGKFIIGKEKEIEEFVNRLKGAIRGSAKVPFLVGPAGTGKTLYQDIFRHALRYASLNIPEQYYYTIEWGGLDEFDKLAGIFPGGVYRAPLHDSPYAVLPEQMQQRLLSFARSKHGDLGVGELNPFNRADGHNTKIRSVVLEKAAAENGGQLTEAQQLEALSRHITIRRQILGEDGSAPVMDAEGREYNPSELFVSRDVVNANILEGRVNNPLAWNYGIIPRANGSALFLDEFPRNDAKLRDMFLRIFESREIKYGGAPVIPIDAFIIAAGNTESMEKMTKEGGAKAHRDRMTPISFNWSIYPHEIAATLMFMYREHSAKPLSELYNDSEFVKTPILDLFPRTYAGQDYLSPDGRYKLYMGSGREKVHVSPHALMFIAMVTASTRLHIDGAEALTKEALFTARTNVYNNPVERLKYLMGESYKTVEGEELDLEKLSALNKEGHFGLSQRDANAWLEHALDMARTNGGDLTTSIVAASFESMMDHSQLEYGAEDKTRKLWKMYANVIAQQLILPRMQKDLLRALGPDMSMVNNTYDEVVLELIAAGRGESTYQHPRHETRKNIDKKRLEEIARIYYELHKEQLDPEQLATMFWATAATRSDTPERSRSQELVDAISMYYSEKYTETIKLGDIADYAETGEGDSDVVARHSELVSNMKELGYSAPGIRETLIYIEELRSKVAEVRARAQQ